MNTKMIRYILARMLGVEAVLLLLPALVSLIYREFSGVFFFDPCGDTGSCLSAAWREETGEQDDLWERRYDRCLKRMDPVVAVWSIAIFTFGLYPELSGCIF